MRELINELLYKYLLCELSTLIVVDLHLLLYGFVTILALIKIITVI